MYAYKFFAVAIATMASTVVADNCFAGYLYCSDNLLSQGDYKTTIQAALRAGGQPDNQDSINRALFSCLVDGEIIYVRSCGGHCVNEAFGTQKNDHC